MRELERRTIFLREHITLPESIALTGETFCEGWVLIKSCDSSWLDKTIRGVGWNSIVLKRRYSRNRFAPTSREALKKGVKQALRKISKHFNTAEIEHVEVTKCLWFYYAKVIIFARQIQESPFLGAVDEPSELVAPMALDARHQM